MLKNTVSKKFFSVLMAAMMAVTLIPTVSFAAGGTFNVPYIYRDNYYVDGHERICSDYTYVTSDNVPRHFTDGWYVFKKGSYSCDFRPEVVGPDVNFIIMDGCAFEWKDGIRVAHHANLNIFGQENGTGTFKLECTKSSPLGGNQEEDARTASLSINGGYIIAWGENGAAGIGAGRKGTFGDIVINGGIVSAWGGGDAAGIGGSEYGGPIRMIMINGGTVSARGGDKRGAGIGGGDASEDGGSIVITGGKVSAGGGGGNTWHGALEQGRGAGIGGGEDRTGPDDILITGGDVTAEGSWYGAGIGGGNDGSSGNITISGGDVKVKCGDRSAGIGGGCGKGIGDDKRVRITGGSVKVTPGKCDNGLTSNIGAGIGGGEYSSQGGKVIISGGEVSTESWAGAGIGGGGASGESGNPGGIVEISGGTVAATSKTGAGIGGGGWSAGFHGDPKANGGNVTISGGAVFITSTEGGAAIGGGAGGDGGKLTITDGYVVAVTSSIKYDWASHIDAKYTGRNYAAAMGTIIGNLLMRAIFSNPVDRSAAAIGGGYVDSAMGGASGDFDMTGGTLIAKSGLKETGAIGPGDINFDQKGSYRLSDDLAVLCSEDLSKTPYDLEYVQRSDRIDTLKNKPYIMIEKCSHDAKKYYNDGDDGHFFYCSRCEKTSSPEPHKWTQYSYNWINNNTSVIAKRICSECGEIDIESAETTSKITKPATCEEPGETTYTAEFKKEYFETQIKTVANINAVGHKYGAWKKLNATQHQRVCAHDKTHVQKANHTWDKGEVTKKATEKQVGIKTYTCTVCKATKTQTIPKLKPSAPKISGTLIAKMTAKGNTGLIISWNKIQGAAGYDIFLARCNHDGKKISCKKVKTIKADKTFRWTRTGLKKGTSYKAYVKAFIYKNGKKSYVRTSLMMHAYTGNGTKYYTNARSVTVNKTAVTLKKGKTFKVKATVNKVSKNRKLTPKDHAPAVRYMTSSSRIATVSSGGRITAKGKGACYIYAFAHNGVSKKVKVTVK